jgi:two-component system, NarL family, sensor histidine kinase UhpB
MSPIISIRIVQEAVTNVRRHANAQVIDVTLDVQPNGVRLNILDDGIGVTSTAAGSAGVGLRIMQCRAEMIGADRSIGPRNGRGTRVTCEYRQRA